MLNKITLIGNLGSDPELRDTNTGVKVCSLSVATSESWKDKQTGEKKTSTEWHKIIFFGAVAEICSKWLKKGSKVYIEGSIQTRKWTDNNGQDKYTTEIKGREMKMLGDNSQQPAKQQQQSTAQASSNQGYSPENFDDQVPF